MSYLLVVVKSHLFLALVHRSQERGKVAAVTSSGHWGERDVVAAINRGLRAWHSGERRDTGILSVAVGRQSIRSEAAVVTTSQ